MMSIKEMLKAQDAVMGVIKHCITLEEENARLHCEIKYLNDANRELRNAIESYKKEEDNDI
jgi:hypothetical protein